MAEANQTKVSKTKVQNKEAEKTATEEKPIKDEKAVPSAAKVKATAKAGKRSEKSLKEAEEKQAKEERKSQAKSDKPADEKPKKTIKQPRSRLERRAKGYRKSAEQIEKGKTYSLAEALELATKTSHVKFDATVELHVKLGVDPKQADQNIRGTVSLPAGTGKTMRVAVYAEGDDIAAAKSAGADLAAGDEFLQQLDKGNLDFDILITLPTMMPKLSKHARVLGPKGLMPNPKSGTVTTNIPKAVKEAKAGRLEYRIDESGIIHAGIGKVSFGGSKLVENTRTLLTSIKGAKPSSIKGNYVQSIHVTTSMGPSIAVENNEL